MAKTKLKKNIRLKSLNPQDAPRVRRELLDYSKEFLNDLKENHPEEYRYLAQFTDEHTAGSISKDSKGRVKAGHIHKTKALAKECYDANNRRNNDVLGVTKANNLLYNIDSEINSNDGWYVTNGALQEDAAISAIDNSKEADEVLSFEEYQSLKNNMTPEMIMFYEALYAELE